MTCEQARQHETPIVELRNVSKAFGDRWVLRDLSVKIWRGQTVAVIGESGCGKSVTMKLMMGLLRPTEGEVLWDGERISRLSEKELTRRRLRFGYLFQGAALFDSLNVYENVAFGLRENTNLPEEEIQKIVLDRLREVGLPPDVCTKKPAELSGGMKKRVGLARALALSPELMFYDEPTTGLDPVMSDVINHLIVATRSHCCGTSVVVTHDMKTVRTVADRVIMLYPLTRLKEGQTQVVFDGTVEQLFASTDPRVSQFVRGEAGERIRELAVA